VSAGRQDHLASADVPQPLARDTRGRFGGIGSEVVGSPLEGQNVVVVVRAEGRGAVQYDDLGGGVECRAGLGDPLQGAPPAGLLGTPGEQRTAGLGLVVDEDHAGAGTRGSGGGRQPGRSGADDQDVGVDVLLVVDGGVGARVEPAHPGQCRGGQAVVQLRRRRGQHALRVRTADLQQGVGFLDARGDDAARAAAVDRRGDLDESVRQHRRGDRVSGVAGQLPAVDGEPQHGAAVDTAALPEPEVLVGHRFPPAWGSSGRGSSSR
jgi:hypothetical protein